MPAQHGPGGVRAQERAAFKAGLDRWERGPGRGRGGKFGPGTIAFAEQRVRARLPLL